MTTLLQGFLLGAVITVAAAAVWTAVRGLVRELRRPVDENALMRTCGPCNGGSGACEQCPRDCGDPHCRWAPEPDPEPCGFCHDLAVMGNPLDCACKRPCGKGWCTALRDAMARVSGGFDEFGRPE